MGNRDIIVLPKPTLQRLPQYLRLLRPLLHDGQEIVSGTSIASELRLDPVQVRKDLQYTGVPGRPNIGYPLQDLIDGIETTLGWNNLSDAFLAGAGDLGSALLGHEEFQNNGLNIVAAFDVDPLKIGMTIHGKEVLSLEKLVNLAMRMHIHIGIITAPEGAARDITDRMVAGGIKAIWNFSSAILDVPGDVVVENAQLTSSLAILTGRLRELTKKQKGENENAVHHQPNRERRAEL